MLHLLEGVIAILPVLRRHPLAAAVQLAQFFQQYLERAPVTDEMVHHYRDQPLVSADAKQPPSHQRPPLAIKSLSRKLVAAAFCAPPALYRLDFEPRQRTRPRPVSRDGPSQRFVTLDQPIERARQSRFIQRAVDID